MSDEANSTETTTFTELSRKLAVRATEAPAEFARDFAQASSLVARAAYDVAQASVALTKLRLEGKKAGVRIVTAKVAATLVGEADEIGLDGDG
ncbi:MAG: hypothetical protein GTN69_02460 [Armatimonadetes bacterium]|nr:hypothetical protein [Armatimonadota bacterium]